MEKDVLDFKTCFGQNIVEAANLVLSLWQPCFFIFYFLITILAEVCQFYCSELILALISGINIPTHSAIHFLC